MQKKRRKKEKRLTLCAQTTPDALFGPVQVTAALPIMYIVDYNIYIWYKH